MLRLSYTVSQQSSWHQAALMFKASVEQRTEGRVHVALFHSGSLVSGNDRVELEMAQAGAIQGVMKSTLWLSLLDDRFAALALPWIFDDIPTAMGRINGPLAPSLAEGVARANLQPLAWGAGGFFQLYSNRGPIRLPADLKGAKIRVPGMALFIDAWRRLGAVPVSMSFAETYPALQAGVVEGGTSPLALIEASRFYEVSRFITRVNFAFEAVGVLINQPFLQSLSAVDQSHVRQAAVQAMAAMTASLEAEERAISRRMAVRGVAVTELSAAQMTAFRQSLAPLYAVYRQRLGDRWVDRVEGLDGGRP